MLPVVSLLLAAALSVAATPEERAIEYLMTEVPRWSRENRCFSCHNNGDGARALYLAAAQKRPVTAESLRDTTDWLTRPGAWDGKIAAASFKDKKLARIQFAAALANALDAGLVADRKLMEQAGDLVLPYQEKDGSWIVDAANAAGSPATYGASLATYLARDVLARTGAARFAPAVQAAGKWLAAREPSNHVDASVVLLASRGKRSDAAGILLRNQTPSGGWGPHRTSPAEPFDTALAIMALSLVDGAARARAEGREFLIRTQLPSGGWPETTRPPGAQSYAQHISTTAWATMALLGSDPKRH